MANIDYITALSDTNFRSRIEGTILKAAPAILIESTAITHHAERRTLARRVLESGVNASEWSRWVVTDPTVSAKITNLASVTDTELDTVIASCWDKVAGFPPGS